MNHERRATANAIISMLKTNTGRSILDSGDFYGRNYEANVLRSFLNEPVFHLSFKNGYIDFSISLFWYLYSNFQYEARLTNSYWKFDDKNDYDPYHKTLLDWATKKGWHDLGGDNTYNGEHWLDQDMQYNNWRDKDGNYFVSIQSHNGCDIRGGYPRPRIFTGIGDGFGGPFYACMPMMDIDCKQCEACWYSDDSCHFYPNDNTQLDLNKLMFIPTDSDAWTSYKLNIDLNKIPDEQLPIWPDYKPKILIKNDNAEYVVGYDEDGKGYCPHCGGELSGLVLLGD